MQKVRVVLQTRLFGFDVMQQRFHLAHPTLIRRVTLPKLGKISLQGVFLDLDRLKTIVEGFICRLADCFQFLFQCVELSVCCFYFFGQPILSFRLGIHGFSVMGSSAV